MSSEGAAVAGHRSLVDPLMSPFIFAFLFFGFVWVLLRSEERRVGKECLL